MPVDCYKHGNEIGLDTSIMLVYYAYLLLSVGVPSVRAALVGTPVLYNCNTSGLRVHIPFPLGRKSLQQTCITLSTVLQCIIITFQQYVPILKTFLLIETLLLLFEVNLFAVVQ